MSFLSKNRADGVFINPITPCKLSELYFNESELILSERRAKKYFNYFQGHLLRLLRMQDLK